MSFCNAFPPSCHVEQPTAARLLYRPSFVVDGNFKLEHLIMRRPDDDVALWDGAGNMVTSGPYMKHLRTAQEPKQVSHYVAFSLHMFH